MMNATADPPTIEERNRERVGIETEAVYEPHLADTVEDTQRQRIGKVMGFVGPYVQLRPVGGGREWDTRPEHLRPVTPAEALSAGVATANARSRGEYR
ncbi:hypothetical protein [Streptomyces sp. NPDC002845]